MSSQTTYTGVPSTPLEPTPTITIEQALRLLSKSLRVCMPAQVVAVNGANRVDVQPGFQARFATEPAAIDLPIIAQVPIVQPQGSGYSIQLPVAEKDTGMLIFADRCIDTWLNGDGAPQDPNDPRLHDLTDAIFVPGLLTTDIAANQTPYGTDLVLRNGTAKLHIQSGGTYTVRNDAAELFSSLSTLCAQLSNAVSTLSSLQGVGVGQVALQAKDPVTGAITPISIAFASVANSLGQVQQQIDSLKGT